jgi:hypothetical protein
MRISFVNFELYGNARVELKGITWYRGDRKWIKTLVDLILLMRNFALCANHLFCS